MSQRLWTSDLSLLAASKVVLIAKPPGFLLMNEHAFILGARVALTPTALFKPSARLSPCLSKRGSLAWGPAGRLPAAACSGRGLFEACLGRGWRGPG